MANGDYGLWGTRALPRRNARRTDPVMALLGEQAEKVGPFTDGVLKGDVETSADVGKLRHAFYVVAPELGGYRYRLFTVWRDQPHAFPVMVDWNDQKVECGDSPAFEERLKTILQHDTTETLLQDLVRLSPSPQAQPSEGP